LLPAAKFRPGLNLEIKIAFNQELYGFNCRIRIEGKGYVDMQHVAKRSAVVEDAQAKPDIAEPAGIHRILGRSPPRPAHIIKYRPANAKQSNRIPIRIDAFFNGEQRP